MKQAFFAVLSLSLLSLCLSGIEASAGEVLRGVIPSENPDGNLSQYKNTVFVEAEGFADKGGWVVDQQFMHIKTAGQAGSSILLAHGMGKPVANAKTTVKLPEPGVYHVFVRTRNWASTWFPKDLSEKDLVANWSPGKFQVLVNGKALENVLGVRGTGWFWDQAGTITVSEGQNTVTVELQDLTGFDGRADALVFTTLNECPCPTDPMELEPIRRGALGLPCKIPDSPKSYEVVVVGGGIAGCCAAISSARLGLKTALIQDRPVLGGNGSTEIRVHLNGHVNLPPYKALGNLTAQMGPHGGGNAREAAHYKDQQRLDLCKAEPLLDVYPSTHVYKADVQDGKIIAVFGKDIETGSETRFPARWFVDCTGDAMLGYEAGADFHIGREAQSEYGEKLAPENPDMKTMGASIQWYTTDVGHETSFPKLPWAHQFNEKSARPMVRGDWDWETGIGYNQVYDFERIRDNGLRAAYGHWSYMKNQAAGPWAQKVKDREFEWVAFLAGKRESRRLLGDVILKQQDVQENKQWDDGCVVATWSIDLHLPEKTNSIYFPGNEFRSTAFFNPKSNYAIPYRTLYSRNIDNLFMAGRNISVTHVALGTVRVMRTGGVMGEVVGMAASLCKKYDTTPRGVYKDHLDELKKLMSEGVGPDPVIESETVKTPKWLKSAGKNLAMSAKATASCEYSKGLYPAKNINDGVADLRDNASRWVSDEKNVDSAETWVILNWKEPVTFNAMRICTGQAGETSPKTPVLNFALQIKKDGKWVNIPGADVKNNAFCDTGLQFDSVTTDSVRLFINQPGYLVRVWELELYNLAK